MSICTKASRAFWIGAGMGFIRIVLRRGLRLTSVPTRFRWDVPMPNAQSSAWRVISSRFFQKKCTKSTRIIHSRHMPNKMANQFHGARQPPVAGCFSLKKEINPDSSAHNAIRSTVSIVVANGTKTWHAPNTKSQTQCQKTTRSSWTLPQDTNSNNAQSASFGLRRLKDVTTWDANASLNSVTSVEVFTWNVNVWRRLVKIMKEFLLQLRY